MLGKYFRKQYGSLFPPKSKKPSSEKKKDKKKKDKTPTYKVWTASSERDIDTAEAYIRGSFPSHQRGGHGEGDGEVVQLIKVPNKAKDWDRSLTPHVSMVFAKRSVTDERKLVVLGRKIVLWSRRTNGSLFTLQMFEIDSENTFPIW